MNSVFLFLKKTKQNKTHPTTNECFALQLKHFLHLSLREIFSDSRPTSQMWPAEQFQPVLGNTAWFDTIPCLKELSVRFCSFWSKSETIHSVRSQVWPEQGMHLLPVLQYQSEAGNTPTGSPLEEMGCLEQDWGLVHSWSVNYCKFTGVCLPEPQRTEDTCITAAFLPRLGLSKE